MINKILLAIFTLSALSVRAITKHYDFLSAYDFISDIFFCLSCCVLFRSKNSENKRSVITTKITSVFVLIASLKGWFRILHLLNENNNSIILTLLLTFSGILLSGLMIYLIAKVCKTNSDK